LNQALELTNQRLATLTQQQKDQLESALHSLTVLEIVSYQEIKSVAQVEGKISLSVALWIYNTIKDWGKSPLAHRIVLTQLMVAWSGVETIHETHS
jgi:hypothetical protein